MAMKGYIKESLLPNCMDLVIWGHEHACEIEGGMHAVPESAEVRSPATRPGGALGTGRGEAPCTHRPLFTSRCSGGAAHSAAAGTSLSLHQPRLAPPRGAPRPSPPALRPPLFAPIAPIAPVAPPAQGKSCLTRGLCARVHRRINSP